jgi:long-chain acyl-CoA synthetase
VGSDGDGDIDIVAAPPKDVTPGSGQAGEIWIAGPTVFTGYWGRSETEGFAAASELDATSGGEGGCLSRWFQTGDLATVDANGYLHVVDRKKDMVSQRQCVRSALA